MSVIKDKGITEMSAPVSTKKEKPDTLSNTDIEPWDTELRKSVPGVRTSLWEPFCPRARSRNRWGFSPRNCHQLKRNTVLLTKNFWLSTWLFVIFGRILTADTSL